MRLGSLTRSRGVHDAVGLELCLEFVASGIERVGDVLEEDQPQRDVLVLGRVEVPPHLVGGGPELLFEADGGAVGLAAVAGHTYAPSILMLATFSSLPSG